MACCSSRSWKAPIYFTMSVVLAFIAISTSLHSKPQDPTSPIKVPSLQLSLNASKALRRAGFNVIATLIQVSPEIFLSSPNATIFAVQDLAISNSSLPPWLLRNLLQYHTCPHNLPMDSLSKKPRGTCLPTLHGTKKIAITRVVEVERMVEINNVLVSHPDVFLAETLSIHGVLEPFSLLDPEDIRQGWNTIQTPECDSKSFLVSDFLETPNVIEWSLIIRLLSSNGFVPFAIGLNSVLDGILEDYRGLESVTIFAPPSLWALTFPMPLLMKTVRFHILPQKLTYQELASMPTGSMLMTLASDLRADVTGTTNFKRGLEVNGVEIVAPNIFSSERFAVHGISRPFEVPDPYNTPIV